MTASTTTGGAPLVVGLGGTLRANSSTDTAVCDQLDMLATQVLTPARAAGETT